MKRFRRKTLLAAIGAVAAAMCFPEHAATFQPNTLQIGTVEIHPSFRTELTFNTNINMTRDPVSDVIFKQIPGLSVRWGRTHTPAQRPRIASPHGIPLSLLLDLYLLRVRPLSERGYLGRTRPRIQPGRPLESMVLSGLRFRRYSLSIDYSPQIINLADNTIFNSVDHELTFAGDLRLPMGLYIRAEDYFLSSTSINSFRREVADFNVALRTQGIGFHTNQAAVTVGYNFYADFLAFVTYTNFMLFLRNVDASRLLFGADVPGILDLEWRGVGSGTLGFSIHAVGFYVSKPIARRTVLSLGYVLGRVDGNLKDFELQASLFQGLAPVTLRVSDDPRDATFHEIRFHLQRILTARQQVFGLGLPKTSLEATFGYQWRNFDGTEIQLDVLNAPVAAFPVVLRDFNEFLVELRLASQIRPKTRVTILFTRYPKEEVAGSGNVTINYRIGFVANQRIGRKWYAGLRGSYRRRENPFERAVERYSDNYEAGVNVSYHLQTWLQGSMIYEFISRNGEKAVNDFLAHRIRLQIQVRF